MIIIPEIETVVVLVPRAMSRSLRAAVRDRYPKAFFPYRHMEADGVPDGYDRWDRVGVVRHPVDRLWSLYNFLRTEGAIHTNHDFAARMKQTVQRPFEDWVVHNDIPFTTPYGVDHHLSIDPFYYVKHCIPENRKSQFVYLRPDLGTYIYRFESDAQELERSLDISLPQTHETAAGDTPALSFEGAQYVQRVFRWDLNANSYTLKVDTNKEPFT